jgi:hypothetical protein
MSPTGSDEFDVTDSASGVYWASPPGSLQCDSSGRCSTSTGSLGFSDTLWSEATNTSDVLEGTIATRSQKGYLTSLQALYDAITGNYFFAPSTSAASSSSGVTAFGPASPLSWQPLPGGTPNEQWYLFRILGPDQWVPVPGLGP